MLNVYSSEPTVGYSGGHLLIAAPNRRMAQRVFEAYQLAYRKTVSDPRLLRGLKATGTRARVLVDNVFIE